MHVLARSALKTVACLSGPGRHKDNQVWHQEQWQPTNETKERLQPGGRPTVPNSCVVRLWACKSTCHCKSSSRSFYREHAALKSERPIWRGGAMGGVLWREISKTNVRVDWWLGIVGFFISGLRSYQWSLDTAKVLGINLISRGQNIGGGFGSCMRWRTALPVAAAVSSSASPLIRLIVPHRGRFEGGVRGSNHGFLLNV